MLFVQTTKVRNQSLTELHNRLGKREVNPKCRHAHCLQSSRYPSFFENLKNLASVFDTPNRKLRYNATQNERTQYRFVHAPTICNQWRVHNTRRGKSTLYEARKEKGHSLKLKNANPKKVDTVQLLYAFVQSGHFRLFSKISGHVCSGNDKQGTQVRFAVHPPTYSLLPF
jgi:hypothetical protein